MEALPLVVRKVSMSSNSKSGEHAQDAARTGHKWACGGPRCSMHDQGIVTFAHV